MNGKFIVNYSYRAEPPYCVAYVKIDVPQSVDLLTLSASDHTFDAATDRLAELIAELPAIPAPRNIIVGLQEVHHG